LGAARSAAHTGAAIRARGRAAGSDEYTGRPRPNQTSTKSWTQDSP
jgi:hypothetical protein